MFVGTSQPTTGTTGSDALTIGNDNTSPAAFSGAMSDAPGGRTLALTKVGTGTLTLSLPSCLWVSPFHERRGAR